MRLIPVVFPLPLFPSLSFPLILPFASFAPRHLVHEKHADNHQTGANGTIPPASGYHNDAGVEYGHTKGMIGFDQKGGFFLTHSAPGTLFVMISGVLRVRVSVQLERESRSLVISLSSDLLRATLFLHVAPSLRDGETDQESLVLLCLCVWTQHAGFARVLHPILC